MTSIRQKAIASLAAEPSLYNATHAAGETYRNHPAWQVRQVAERLENTQSREQAAASLLHLVDLLTTHGNP